MQIIQSQVFKEEILNIDDTHYVDCTLTNCQLQYSGRPVVFERTRLNGCRYMFLGTLGDLCTFSSMLG